MKQFFPAIILAIWVATFAFSQTITYQGATLHPGDVINFHKGPVTTGDFISYGHSGMYLGMDPHTGNQSFLDFNIGNSGHRLISEWEFLNRNSRLHPGFDVFRLSGAQKPDPTLLLEAARVVVNKSYDPGGHSQFTENCASAIASVLSEATSGRDISAWHPDHFLRGDFKRHPQLVGKSINMQIALLEAESRAVSPPRVDRPRVTLPPPRVSTQNVRLGSYSVTGTNPDGSSYRGTAAIEKLAENYRITWNIGRDTFHGSGPLAGNVLTINWRRAGGGMGGVVIYKVVGDGTLTGTWSGGNATEVLVPR
jgi:hypothetical protein